MIDPLGRLTNLVALLLETRLPLSRDEIFNELSDYYAGAEEARRGTFERDKRELRTLGIPLTTTVLGGDRAGETGYRILRSDFELGDLGLTEEERHALQIAVATVRLGAGWGNDALIKLGGDATDDPGPVAALLSAPTALPALYEADAQHRQVHFTYHGSARHLEPWGLLQRGGFWYVVGYDMTAQEQRTYRVDRITGEVSAGEPNAFARPHGFDVRTAFPADAKLLQIAGGGPSEAVVAVDADRAHAVLRELGEAAMMERRADGSVLVRVPCLNRLVFRGWLLGFLEHAEVLQPAEVREEIVAWLRQLAGGDG
jgi:predicted DNA-binding transcriptional regulator YafY